MDSKPSPTFRKPAKIAFALFAVGALPLGAMAAGLYHVGMCDPTPLLAVGWLELLCLIGTGFAIRSWIMVGAHGSMMMPAFATLLNLIGVLIPPLLLVLDARS